MNNDIERRLQERMLLDRRAVGDRLMLDDATLLAALDGSRPLTAGERTALQASPLTARRLRTLAVERSTQRHPRAGGGAIWQPSTGMLRAASTASTILDPIATDDGWWTLHFVQEGAGWRTILQLSPHAPFAATLLSGATGVRVRGATGNPILHGVLDADGECEDAWPYADAPAAWLQTHGAAFRVEPA